MTRLAGILCTLLLVVLVLPPAVAAGPDEEPLHVLVVNDDGVDAPGIAALAAALAADPGYRVTVAAPAEQQSVTGHGLVTRREVEVRAHEPLAGCPTWSVSATPASVTRLALTALLAQDPPGLVVSGVNRGENEGLSAWTSGTVAAAREAVLHGLPAVALSLQLEWRDPQPDFAAASRWAKPLIDHVRDHGLPPGVLLNVNIPRTDLAIRGYRLCRMGPEPSAVNHYELVRVDDDGARWYTSLWAPPIEGEEGTDVAALREGFVTVVPLGLDQTAYRAIPALQELASLGGPVPAPAATTP